MWPPQGLILYPIVVLIYYIGFCLQNSMLASELIRKTQLESEQLAAQQIQKTLQPTTIGALPGYEVDAFYKPLRAVGGDYFDVIDLPGNRTLFALADVAGKGIAAALLAANIQALVRSLSSLAPDVPVLASQINRHLCRYTPGNRFATAVFIVLDRESGELVYVNAGHNPPIVWSGATTSFLEPTGTALGWFDETTYDARRIAHAAGWRAADLHRRVAGLDSREQSRREPVPGPRRRSAAHDGQPQGTRRSEIQRGRCHGAAGEADVVRSGKRKHGARGLTAR